MIALAAALLLASPQDESRLKEAWPKLVEAWKSAEAYQASPGADGDDEILKTAGKIHEAFESAGLYVAEGEYVPLAIKAFIKARFRGWFRGGAAFTRQFEAAYRFDGMPADPMKSFVDSLVRLKALEKNRFD